MPAPHCRNGALPFHNRVLVHIIKLILKFRFLPSFSEFDIYYGKIPPVFLYFGARAYWVLLRWPPFLPIHAHALHRLRHWVQIFSVVKVSKSQNKFMKASLLPKYKRRISALASNQKNKGFNYGLFNIIGIIIFFDSTTFYRLGQKSLKYFVRFLGESRRPQIAIEIYWPLAWWSTQKYSFRTRSKV